MTMGLLSPYLMGSPQKLGGLLGQQPQPQTVFPPVPPAPMSSPSGGFGGFGSGEPNYALMALGQGIANGNVGGAFQQYAPLMAANQSRNKTRQWLVSKGMSPEDADVYASNPTLLSSILNNKPEDDWMSAGDGVLFNKRTQEFKQSPLSGTKAPQIETLYDENGNEYKGRWNAQTGSYDKIGGTKLTRDKVDDYTKKNRSLASVIDPERNNLLGDGTTPGKFDALANTASQAGDLIGGLGKGYGVDLSGFTTSSDYQSAKNSLLTIVSSYLYSVSGAQAPEQEVVRQAGLLMPRPGESTQSVADKKRRIQSMVDAVKMAAEGGGTNGGNTIPAPGGDQNGDGVVDYRDYFNQPQQSQ